MIYGAHVGRGRFRPADRVRQPGEPAARPRDAPVAGDLDSFAIGAGRWRIIQQLLVESVMLSAIGGFLGWWIAKWGVRTYELAMAAKSSWLIIDYTMDQRVVAYLIALSTGTGLLFGLAPALRLSRLDINVALKDGGRGATGGGRGRRLSALLVTGEMALAVVLLAGAGVMLRSYLKIHSADMGVDIAAIVGASLICRLTGIRVRRIGLRSTTD